jgi:PPM family protein phosphatase
MDPVLSAQESVLASLARSQLKGILSPLAEWACIGTRPGLNRATTEANEDRLLCARLTYRFGPQADVFVLCDGIGGMADGGRCAEIATAAFILSLSSRVSLGPSDPRGALRDAATIANRKVFAEYAGRGGTTLSCVLIVHGTFYACSIGDTRIFAVDETGARQLTVDDTMRSALAAAGQETSDLGPEHDRLVQFVGMGADLQAHVDELKVGPGVRFFLLCTDGAYRLPGDLFANVATHASTARELVERLLTVAKWVGVTDDASAVALSSKLLDAAPHGEQIQHNGQSTVLRVWGVGQLGQPALLWFNAVPERALGRPVSEPHYVQSPRTALSLGAPPVSIDASKPAPPRKKRRSKERRHNQQLLTRHGPNANAISDGLVIEVVRPQTEATDTIAKQVPAADEDAAGTTEEVVLEDDEEEDRIRRRDGIVK